MNELRGTGFQPVNPHREHGGAAGGTGILPVNRQGRDVGAKAHGQDGGATLARAALLVAALLFAGVSVAEAADAVALRSEVTVSGASVKLRDVASLEGDYARGMGDVEVATFAPGQSKRTLAMGEVRRRLSDSGAHWGRLILRGSSAVTLRRISGEGEGDAERAAEGAGRPEPIESEAGPAAANPLPEVTAEGLGESAGESLRRRLERWIGGRVGAEGDDLRVEFDDADAPFLGTAGGPWRHEFEPLSSDLIGRVPVVVRRYEGDRLLATERVRADVSVRRPVVVAVRTLSRGRTITDGDVELRRVWLDSGRATPLDDPSGVVGLRAAGLVREGSVLGEGDVSQPLHVRRGQMVTVRCISGGLVLRTVARAMEDAEAGAMATVRNERTRERFRVRMTGPQEAVLKVDDAPDQRTATLTHGDTR